MQSQLFPGEAASNNAAGRTEGGRYLHQTQSRPTFLVHEALMCCYTEVQRQCKAPPCQTKAQPQTHTRLTVKGPMCIDHLVGWKPCNLLQPINVLGEYGVQEAILMQQPDEVVCWGGSVLVVARPQLLQDTQPRRQAKNSNGSNIATKASTGAH